MKKRSRFLRFLLLGVAVLLLFCLVAGGWIHVRDYSTYFLERRGTLVSVEKEDVGRDSVAARSWVTLRSDAGLTVECGLLAPRSNEGRRSPAIILLGGKATGKHAVNYALGIEGVVIVAPDYPFTARDSYTVPQFIGDIPEIRLGLIDMVPSVLLTVDYLHSRADVDTTRIILMGYSFGAPLVPVIVAHDRRPAAAVMVYGGGDLRTLIGHNVARYEGAFLGAVAGWVSAWLLHPLEPLRYADRIAPMPALMINGTDDEQIPWRNAELLYDALREPKRIVWLDSRHVNPRNPDLTRRIIAVLERELLQLHLLP